MKQRFYIALLVALIAGGAVGLISCAHNTVDKDRVMTVLKPVMGRTEAWLDATEHPALVARYAAARAGLDQTLGEETIPAEEAEPFVVAICEIHDGLLRLDDTPTADQRKAYLTSTKLLRLLFTEAAAPL